MYLEAFNDGGVMVVWQLKLLKEGVMVLYKKFYIQACIVMDPILRVCNRWVAEKKKR